MMCLDKKYARVFFPLKVMINRKISAKMLTTERKDKYLLFFSSSFQFLLIAASLNFLPRISIRVLKYIPHSNKRNLI